MQRYIKILFSIIFRDNFIPTNKKIGIFAYILPKIITFAM